MKQTEDESLRRRDFFRGAGIAGAGVAALLLDGPFHVLDAQVQGGARQDTPAQIFTAALIAEDLATTFYYNGLIGGAIQDSRLAGTGGTATSPSANARVPNIQYLQAALTQEIAHAALLRSLIKGTSAATDPYQTFYFPAGTFDTLNTFLATLDALENAFIGAYLSAVREFSYMASMSKNSGSVYGNVDGTHIYTTDELQYFSQVSASIMAIESEHRVLGRVISQLNPPSNNLTYAQLSGVGSVYNGSSSAVVALTPFLTPSTGPAYSFATAMANQAAISLPSTGSIPAF